MLRKQGLAAPVSARPDLPERSPALAVRRNRRTFTLADQVNLLVSAREADSDLGFMGRTMALCSLPRTNPGNQHQYKRKNGPFELVMIAGADNKLPFGNFPRLLMAWVSTEAVRTQYPRSWSCLLGPVGIPEAPERSSHHFQTRGDNVAAWIARNSCR